MPLFTRFVAFGLIFLCSSSLPGREWTSRNGKFKIEAEFVAVKKGKVVLEKADGSYLSVPLEQLSDEDKEFIEEQTGKSSDSGDSDTDESADKEEESSESTGVAPQRVIKLKGSKAGEPAGEVRSFGDQGWGIKSMAFSPSGAFLAAGKTDNTISIFDVNEGSTLNTTDRLSALGQVQAIKFTPDGKKLIAGGYSGLIMIWNIGEDGSLEDAGQFAGHTSEVHSIAISADGKFALSGGDKTVCYWQIDTGKEFATFNAIPGTVKACWISPDGKRGLASDGCALLKIDLKTRKTSSVRFRPQSPCQFVAISPDGQSLATDDSYNVRTWSLANGKERPPFVSKEIQWYGVFTPDGSRLITGGNAVANVWSFETKNRVAALPTTSPTYVQALAASPDNLHFACIPGIAGGILQIFRLPPK